MDGTRYGPTDSREQVAELLQAVAGLTSAKAAKIAAAFPGGRGLRDATATELAHLGLTDRQAAVIVAAFTLSRVVAVGACDGPRWREQATTPEAIAGMLIPWLRGAEQESFLAVYLDARQRLISIREVARGSLAQVDVHPRELFKAGVRLAAHSIIMCHNHPSGDPEASTADIELTHRMAEVGRLMGIPVLDHLVIAGDRFTSLAAAGLLA